MIGLRTSATLALLVLLAPRLYAQDVRIAAAADLQAALPEIARRFEVATKLRVEPVYGSSGLLSAQIQNGAPFDVYMSADIEYPRQLATQGFAEPGAVVPYAVGRIVLWTRNGTKVDLEASLKGLASPSIRLVAIGNPAHAPYGRAAEAALKHEGVYEALRGRLVLGENIAQTSQFAETGNADAAITALALAVSPALTRSGRYVVIPAEWHPPIVQGAVWLKSARNQTAARRFVEFLTRPDTAAYLRTMGFEPVKPAGSN